MELEKNKFITLLLLFNWILLHFHLPSKAFESNNTDKIQYFSTDLFSCKSRCSTLKEEDKFQVSEYKSRLVSVDVLQVMEQYWGTLQLHYQRRQSQPSNNL